MNTPSLMIARGGSLILLVAAMAAGFGCGDGSCERPATPTTTAATASASALPTALPQVALPQLQALIQEAASQDKVLVIDFWATWCAPCVALFPELHEALTALGDGVRPASVTCDAPGPGEKQAIAFLAKHHALTDAYLLKPDPDAQIAVVDALGEQWTNLNPPAIFVFDREGKLAGEFYEGATAAQIAAKVSTLLSSSSRTPSH
jgi:thiol-disulfide isomerase/thioredoxin